MHCNMFAAGHNAYLGMVNASLKSDDALLPFRVTLIDGQLFQATIDEGAPLWFWLHHPNSVADLFDGQRNYDWAYDPRYGLVRPMLRRNRFKVFHPVIVPVGKIRRLAELRRVGPCA